MSFCSHDETACVWCGFELSACASSAKERVVCRGCAGVAADLASIADAAGSSYDEDAVRARVRGMARDGFVIRAIEDAEYRRSVCKDVVDIIMQVVSADVPASADAPGVSAGPRACGQAPSADEAPVAEQALEHPPVDPYGSLDGVLDGAPIVYDDEGARTFRLVPLPVRPDCGTDDDDFPGGARQLVSRA